MRDAAPVSRDELENVVRGLNLWSERVPDAVAMAEGVHANQRRAGGGPYLDEHIYPVTASVARFLADHERSDAADGVLVALLHDAIEDSTTVTRQVVESRFGDAIALRVAVLTKPKKHLKSRSPSSEEEESRYVEGIRAADFVTRAVKVLDRLNNLASVHERGQERRQQYLDETRRHRVDLARSVDESLAALMRDLLAEQESRLAAETTK